MALGLFLVSLPEELVLNPPRPAAQPPQSRSTDLPSFRARCFRRPSSVRIGNPQRHVSVANTRRVSVGNASAGRDW
eukprot:1020954-Rhodomonas_salina.2